MEHEFRVPKTLSEGQEFGLFNMPFYFRPREWGLVVSAGIAGWFALQLVSSVEAVRFLGCIIIGMVFAIFLKRFRRGKPESYLWDAVHAAGIMTVHKGWFRHKRRWTRRRKALTPQPLDWFPSRRPSSFVPIRKLGDRTGFQAHSVFRHRVPHFGSLEDPLLTPSPIFPPVERDCFAILDTTGTETVFSRRWVREHAVTVAVPPDEEHPRGAYRVDREEPDGCPMPVWWRRADGPGVFEAIVPIPVQWRVVHEPMLRPPSPGGGA